MVSIHIFKPLSTFSSQAVLLINKATLTIFSSEKIVGTLGIKPWAAGSGSKYANHCTYLHPFKTMHILVEALLPIMNNSKEVIYFHDSIHDGTNLDFQLNRETQLSRAFRLKYPSRIQSRNT